MMKWILAVLLVLVVVTLLLCWRSYEVSDWCAWVNQVQIAGQPGSDASVVRQMLGPPDRVSKPAEIGRGFLPRPPATDADTVYVYKRAFSGAGYWAAYVFLDAKRRVIRVHLGQS
jgi:hypothetical protein